MTKFRPATAIITGGASGIGRALAAALVEQVASERGRLEMMVNNAGVLFAGPFEGTTERHWTKAIDVNLRGVIHGAHAAYGVMLRQRVGKASAGVILNTGSLAGLIPAPTMTPHATTKWAVVGFSQALHAQARRHGIQGNIVCPAYVDTKLIDDPFEPSRSYAVGSFRRNTRLYQPRLTTPARVAEVALRSVEDDRPVITVGGFAALSWRTQRFAPAVMRTSTRLQAAREARQGRTVSGT